MKKSALLITLFVISLFWVFNAQAQSYKRTGSIIVSTKTTKEVTFFVCAPATYGWTPSYKFEYFNYHGSGT